MKLSCAFDRTPEGDDERLLDEIYIRVTLSGVPGGQPLEEKDRGLARSRREVEARGAASETTHQLCRELDVIAVVATPSPKRAEEALARVVEDNLVSVADRRLTAQLPDRDGRPWEDDVRLGRNAVQALPAAALRRAPELAQKQVLADKQRPTDRVHLHLTVQTSNGGRSSPRGSSSRWPVLGLGSKRLGCAGAACDGASRTRTGDLLGAIQALSQLSYSPAAGESVASVTTRTAARPACRRACRP